MFCLDRRLTPSHYVRPHTLTIMESPFKDGILAFSGRNRWRGRDDDRRGGFGRDRDRSRPSGGRNGYTNGNGYGTSPQVLGGFNKFGGGGSNNAMSNGVVAGQARYNGPPPLMGSGAVKASSQAGTPSQLNGTQRPPGQSMGANMAMGMFNQAASMAGGVGGLGMMGAVPGALSWPRQ